MIPRRNTTAAAVMSACVLAAPAGAEPRLQDVLASATLSFGNDGTPDRVLLVQNDDAQADLYIYRGVQLPEAGKPPDRPAFLKKNVVFAGTAWGQAASLKINQQGSLVITSGNSGIGRDKWAQSLTVILRKGTFVIAGVTYSAYDGLDAAAGGSCDINLLTGKAVRNGKAVADKVASMSLAEWSSDKLPKPCKF